MTVKNVHSEVFGVKFCGVRSLVNLAFFLFLTPILVWRWINAWLGMLFKATKHLFDRPLFMLWLMFVDTITAAAFVVVTFGLAFGYGLTLRLYKLNINLS